RPSREQPKAGAQGLSKAVAHCGSASICRVVDQAHTRSTPQTEVNPCASVIENSVWTNANALRNVPPDAPTGWRHSQGGQPLEAAEGSPRARGDASSSIPARKEGKDKSVPRQPGTTSAAKGQEYSFAETSIR